MIKRTKKYLFAECAILLIFFALSLTPHIIVWGAFPFLAAVASMIASIFIGLMSFGMFILAISDYRDKLYCKMLFFNFILFNVILFLLKFLAVMSYNKHF